MKTDQTLFVSNRFEKLIQRREENHRKNFETYNKGKMPFGSETIG